MKENNELNLKDLENVSGGYILDLGDEAGCSLRYAIIDDTTGKVVTRTNTLRGAQIEAHGCITGLGEIYNDEIITLDQYEKIFNKSYYNR